MRSCEQASTVASAAFDRRLTVSEFIGLWIHRALCGPCRIYRKQLLAMRQRARTLTEETPTAAPLDSSAKDRIRTRLQKETSGSPEK
jgi:hypothetical protein